ncbi:MAG: hypothetical protein HY671_03865 [Chloroflexi bacterium]|nr:hypothetical protein [Chloroflexota bacterium]
MIKRLLLLGLVVLLALMPVSLARAGTFTVDVPETTLTVTQAGDAEIAFEDGVLDDFEVKGREYAGEGVEVLINGVSYMANVCVSSNLELAGLGSIIADHDGAIGFHIGEDMLRLEYTGTAKITKDMDAHTKTIYSTGDFKVVDGTGLFEDVKGVEGTYKLTIVEHGLKAGSMAGFKFSAMEVMEAEEDDSIL